MVIFNSYVTNYQRVPKLALDGLFHGTSQSKKDENYGGNPIFSETSIYIFIVGVNPIIIKISYCFVCFFFFPIYMYIYICFSLVFLSEHIRGFSGLIRFSWQSA